MDRKCFNKFWRLLLAVALLTFAAAAWGADTTKTFVNGKELDVISDILAETNGGKTSMPKHSLLLLPAYTEGKTAKQGWIVNAYKQDGSKLESYKSNGSVFGNDSDMWKGEAFDHGGIHPAVAQYLSGNGKGRYVLIHDNPQRTNHIPRFDVQLYLVEKEPRNDSKAPTFTKVGEIKKVLGESREYPTYLLDAKGGLRVDKDKTNEEYFVVSTVLNGRFAEGSGWCTPELSFFKVTEDGNGKASFTEEKLSITYPLNIAFSPAQIAVGDFTGEGITNQVALVTSDSSAVWLVLHTIRKKSDGSLEAVKTKEEKVYTYAGGIGAYDAFFSCPVADVAAGDFDGDGKTELAVVYKTNETGVKLKGVAGNRTRGSAAVKIYKWSGGAFKTAQTIKDWNWSESPLTAPDETRSVAWLKPVAADLDGDGKHELAILVVIWDYYFGRYLGESGGAFFHMTFWSCNKGSIQPVFNGPEVTYRNKNFVNAINWRQAFGPGKNFETKKLYVLTTPYYQRVFSIAAGPFRGKMGKSRTRDDVVLSFQDSHSDVLFSNVNLSIFWPKSDAFTGWNCEESSVGTVADTSTAQGERGCGIGVAAADFLREGADLGEPQHLLVSDRWTCSAIIQAPPYHFDTIPVPWATDAKPWPVNFNYEFPAKTTYSRSGSSTDAKDTKFEATTSLEGIAPLNLEVSSRTLDTVKDVVKAVGTFALGTDAVGKFVGGDLVKGLTDKMTATETKLTNESKTVGWTNTIEADGTDSQLFYITRTHVWRYPVKAPVPAWLVGKLESGSELAANGDFYITVVAPDQPITGSSKSLHTVRQGKYAANSLYQPTHEEGNLFSYPTTLSAIPGYAARQFSLIPKVMPISYSPNQEKHKATVETSQGKTESKSKEIKEYGTISRALGTVKKLSGNGDFDARPNTRQEGFTKKFNNSEAVEVTFPAPNKSFPWQNVTFDSQFDMYVDEGGIMTVGFAVTDLPESARLWGPDSVYRKQPDPALVLPNRYVFLGEVKQEIGKTKQVMARTERDAMKMRGVRILNMSTSAYTSGIVYPGLDFRIEVPIYNASFLPDGRTLDVPVSLYYRAVGSDENGTLIGTDTPKIGGWKKGTEDNKAWAKFEWKKVPELKEGVWEFYAVIDPEKKIDEVHEAWSKETPEGNNTGYFPFGISYGGEAITTKMSREDFDVKYKTRSGKDDKVKTAFLAARAEDEDWTDWSDWTEDTNFSEMVSGDTEFAITISYKDVDVLNEAWFEVLIDQKDSNGAEYTLSLMADMFPALAQNDEASFSFIINEEEIEGGRDLRMVISDGDEIVVFPLDNATDDGGSTPGGDTPSGGDSTPGSDTPSDGGSSSSSGCDLGFGGILCLIGLAATLKKR